MGLILGICTGSWIDGLHPPESCHKETLNTSVGAHGERLGLVTKEVVHVR
jgi:hypothetical protein